MSEKLCLQWNDFKANAVNTFGSLKEDKDFTDVTLACEDGKQVEAHKVVLANSSPLFQNLLRRNKHTHPLIYMRGVKSDDLLAIVDFLYCGEANVYKENLVSFLAFAEELQLKGLMGKDDKDEVVQDDAFKMPALKKVKPGHKKEFSKASQTYFGGDMARNPLDMVSGELALTNKFPLADFQELEDKCISMMEKTLGKNAHGQPLYQCKVCGKENINGAIKSHIEVKHMEGLSIPCSFCGNTFRSRKSLAEHSLRKHKDCKENMTKFSSSIF